VQVVQKSIFLQAALNGDSLHPAAPHTPTTIAEAARAAVDAGARSVHVHAFDDAGMLDCGCTYQGYQSDISRTFVHGEASKKQRHTVRAFYATLGYGPGYKTPGTPHRLGHGIGMDGHEQVNFVGGETTPLQPGMCFSNEPGMYISGEFGVRLDDCMYITDFRANWFSVPPPSIDQPFA
jgi:Xaa-Pro aminopeptidase